MKIEKKELIIRSACPEDAPMLTAWWNDAKVMAHAPYPECFGLSEEAVLEGLKTQQAGKETCLIAFEGKPIGECSYALKPGHASMGINICVRKYQNKGLGTRMLKDFLRFLFTDKELRSIQAVDRIQIEVNPKNKRACHVFEKLGFLCVKTEKNARKDLLGKTQALATYSLSWERYANFAK
ncbi:MAG: GNAT family protein [Anaerolineaceae bacterium]|nr:GNAT family protein [Anaerolineaceae bacterium]